MTAGTFRLAAPLQARRYALRLRLLGAIRFAIPLLIVANLGRVPLLSTGDREAPLLLNDLCMMGMLVLGGIAGVTRRSFVIDRVTILALLFASIGAYSAILAIPRYGITPWQLVISLAYLARWLVYFGFYVVIINVLRDDDILPVWRTLETTILAFAAFGLFQAAFIPHFAQVVYPNARVMYDFDEQGHRLVSSVLEPNMAGAMIMLVFLVQLAQLAAGARLSSWKPLLLFAALIATLSRSSMLGLIVGSLIILLVRGVSARLLRVAGSLGLLALAAAPWLVRFANSYNKLRIDASALTRVASWLRALRIFSDHPVLGIGFNTYAFVQERYGYLRLGNGTYSVDGGLLFIALMTGLVGVSIYIAMIVVVLKRCRRVWRAPGVSVEFRALATGIFAGTVALCVHSVFVNSLLTSFVMEPLFVLWALAFGLARSLERPAAIREVPFQIASGMPT